MFQPRKTIRKSGFDYAKPGSYFVTFYTKNRDPMLGEIRSGIMRRNAFGRLVEYGWRDLPNHYGHVSLDEFVVMPDHVHGIVVLQPEAAVSGRRHGLPEIVRALKSFSARRINELRGTPGCAVWHRSYWDVIIRDDRALWAIRHYIRTNPARWRDGAARDDAGGT